MNETEFRTQLFKDVFVQFQINLADNMKNSFFREQSKCDKNHLSLIKNNNLMTFDTSLVKI